MRKLLCLILALAMVFSLAACGNGNSEPTNEPSSSNEPKNEKVKVIYIGGTLGDAGIADATYEGYERMLEELPVDGEFVELPTDPSAYKATLLDACDKSPDMIFTSANNGMIDEVLSAAPDFPEIKFMVLDTALGQPGLDGLDNVLGILCAQNEVSFLTGYLAMKMSETGKVGIVVGVEYPTLSDFITGYINGALHANPNAQVAVSASGDFVDQAAAKETALAQIRQGCDVIYAVGAGSSFGTLEACKEAGVWGIGCDTDLAAQFIGVDDEQADCIITSAYKDWGAVSYNWVKRVIENPDALDWGTVEVYGIANGGCKIIENEIYNKQVPDEIKAEMNNLIEDVRNGELECPSYFDMTEDEYLDLKNSVMVK
ncbi:MAG: BMP family ABC transporter substrate-binding protein [Acetivibrionales bacterium]|mgnify:CR=1 FL=1|jgi:basic membrane protein A|nr:BMP family ABC transporter substrate-binding protein [Clostridiaceae bacterium]